MYFRREPRRKSTLKAQSGKPFKIVMIFGRCGRAFFDDTAKRPLDTKTKARALGLSSYVKHNTRFFFIIKPTYAVHIYECVMKKNGDVANLA